MLLLLFDAFLSFQNHVAKSIFNRIESPPKRTVVLERALNRLR